MYFRRLKMEEEKITLPKELQEQMIKFFLTTSVPRKKKEKNRLLSEKNNTDGRFENENNAK